MTELFPCEEPALTSLSSFWKKTDHFFPMFSFRLISQLFYLVSLGFFEGWQDSLFLCSEDFLTFSWFWAEFSDLNRWVDTLISGDREVTFLMFFGGTDGKRILIIEGIVLIVSFDEAKFSGRFLEYSWRPNLGFSFFLGPSGCLNSKIQFEYARLCWGVPSLELCLLMHSIYRGERMTATYGLYSSGSSRLSSMFNY